MFLLGSFLFVALCAYAALSDLQTRRVDNKTNALLFGSGLVFQTAATGGMGLLAGLGGAALGLAILIAPFSRRWVGGGDVKFLAAAGAWLAPVGVASAALVGLALGGVWATALVLRRAGLRREVASNLKHAALTLSDPRVGRRSDDEVIPLVVPMAIACVGTLMVMGGVS